MSSTPSTDKASASDKVDVSFVTDDEETSSSSDESEAETTSSSESGKEEKSDGDGDADDESELPTFTLSLQSSTGTNDADDALPDLSLSATNSSRQETQVKTVVTETSSLTDKIRASSSVDETKTDAAASQSTTSSSTKVSDIAKEKETPSQVMIPAKEEVEIESSEELEESEEEEEEEEEVVKHEEQNLQSASTTATSFSEPVSTKAINIKEDLTVTSTKLPVTESKLNVDEVEEEHIATVVVETETIHSEEKSNKKYDSNVTKVEDKHSSSTKDGENSSIKEMSADVKIDAGDNNLGISKTEVADVAKLEVTNDPEAASVSSKSSKKTEKESATKKATLESTKADAADSSLISANILKTNDVKHEHRAKETIELTDEKATKSSASVKPAAKLPKASKGEETIELKSKELFETVDDTKSGKSRKTKVDRKEIKQEVTKTAEKEQPVSVTVAAEQNSQKSESEKTQTSKTIIDDANSKPQVNRQKAKEVDKHEKGDGVPAPTTVEKTAKSKSEELVENVSNSISQTTKTSAVEVALSGSGDVASSPKEITPEPSERKLPSKKKSKHSLVESKESEVKSAAADTPAAVANDQKHDNKESKSILESNVTPKTAVETASERELSSISVTESKPETNVTESQSIKDTSIPAANFSEDAKVDGMKINTTGDEGKLLAADDEEFRPRRNSIDEFIKRILAEAREEQKKIFDSCAASSGGETTMETNESKAAEGPPSSRGTESELQQPVVNGLDVGLTTPSARKHREDFDIDEELADISRYYAKRTLIDRVSTNDQQESTEIGSAAKDDALARSKIVANGDESLPLTSNEEMLHFVPQRREATAAVVRESLRPVRILVDQQTTVIRQLTETSRAIDELDNEIRQLRQSTGGREALYASIGASIRDELRIYEIELTASSERLGQQRLPGGGRFIREQFVAQCATDLLQRTAATNGPRLDRAASVDDWTRVGRRRSGSFSAVVDDDVGSGTRTAAKQWIVDREPTDLSIQYQHSRSGSVVSDRGYSSIDAADESRPTSSLLSRLTAFSGLTTATELDLGRYSRASSESRPTYSRSHSISDDWLSTGSSSYAVGRPYVGYSLSSAENTDAELDVGYHRISAARPPVQPSHRRYHPPSVDASTATPSRLYVRRGSLQSYSSYDSGSTTGNEVGRSFNSRFLSRVREKKALGETTSSHQTSGDKPFRSRFLKSSSGSTSSTSRSYEYKDI